MQYSVRNRRRLKQTGSNPALTVTAPAKQTEPVRPSVPTLEAWLVATAIERTRE